MSSLLLLWYMKKFIAFEWQFQIPDCDDPIIDIDYRLGQIGRNNHFIKVHVISKTGFLARFKPLPETLVLQAFHFKFFIQRSNTLMLTTISWWLMMVTVLKCWLQNHSVVDFFIGDIFHMKNRSSTPQMAHQYLAFVTNLRHQHR